MRSVRNLSIAAVSALATLVLAAGPAASYEGAIPNPVAARIGDDFAVADVQISYQDGVFRGHIDRGARAHIERRMPTERRAEFEQFAQARGLTSETSAERLSEFLALQNFRTRLPPKDGASRNLRVVVTVEKAHAPSMARVVLVPFTPVFPKLDATFSIVDAATGAPVASGRIRGIFSEGHNIEEARRRSGLDYNVWSASDVHFQTLAGLTNALAASIQQLLQSPTLPAGSATLGQAWVSGGGVMAPVPITVSHAVFEIALAPEPQPAQTPTPETLSAARTDETAQAAPTQTPIAETPPIPPPQ